MSSAADTDAANAIARVQDAQMDSQASGEMSSVADTDEAAALAQSTIIAHEERRKFERNMRLLNAELKTYNLFAKDTDHDGNCLFQAVVE